MIRQVMPLVQPLPSMGLHVAPVLHAPLLQLSPAAQMAPQAPQLFTSAPRSTHLPPQIMGRIPEVHAAWQTPAMHASPAAQSASVLHAGEAVQAPFMHAWPAAQSASVLQACGLPQTPATQARPLGQAEPQAPQFWGSLVRSTQAVPQSVPPVQPLAWHWPATQASPAAQSASVLHVEEAVQAPLPHVCPAGQKLKHAPQLLASLRRSTQLLPQSVSPTAQMPAWQLPPTQARPAAQSASVAQPVTHWPLLHVPPLGQVAPLSITPSQSLSMPSQTSALGVQVVGVSQAPAMQASPLEQSASVAQAWAQKPVEPHTAPAGHCALLVQAMGSPSLPMGTSLVLQAPKAASAKSEAKGRAAFQSEVRSMGIS
jgi:hypothetical protein